MDAVIRATAIYLFVWLVFRIAGQRTLSDATMFDFVLLLIIAETTQQALLGEDFSVTNAFILITTLVGIDILMSLLKQKFPRVGRVMDGEPVLIVENGRPIEKRLARARIDREDILEAARRLQGLERMDQIKFAVLEQSGGITIIPKEPR
jgi:uncharacterized membrane protein YcaP (DUF421 family)